MAKLLVTDETLRQRLLSKGINPDAPGNAEKLQKAGFNLGEQPQEGALRAFGQGTVTHSVNALKGLANLPADVLEAVTAGIADIPKDLQKSRTLEETVNATVPRTTNEHPDIHAFFDQFRATPTEPSLNEQAHPIMSGLSAVVPLIAQLALTRRAGGALAETRAGRAVAATALGKRFAAASAALEDRSLLSTRGIKLAPGTSSAGRELALDIARRTPPRFGLFAGLQPSAVVNRVVREAPLLAVQGAVFTPGTVEDRLRAGGQNAAFGALFSGLGTPEGVSKTVGTIRGAAAGAVSGSTPFGMFGDPTEAGAITETIFGAVTGRWGAHPIEQARPVSAPNSMPTGRRGAAPETVTKGPTVVSGQPTVEHLQTAVGAVVDNASRLLDLRERVKRGEVVLTPEENAALESAISRTPPPTSVNVPTTSLFPEIVQPVSLPATGNRMDLPYSSGASGIQRIRDAVTVGRRLLTGQGAPPPLPPDPPSGPAPKRLVPRSLQLPEGHIQRFVSRDGLWSQDAKGNYFLTRSQGTEPRTPEQFIQFMSDDSIARLKRYVWRNIVATPSTRNEIFNRFRDLVENTDEYIAWEAALGQTDSKAFDASHYHALFNVAATLNRTGLTLQPSDVRALKALRASVARLGASTDPKLIVARAYRGDPSLGKNNIALTKDISPERALDLYNSIVAPANALALDATLADEGTATLGDTTQAGSVTQHAASTPYEPAPEGPAATTLKASVDRLNTLVEDAMEKYGIDPDDPKARQRVIFALKENDPAGHAAVMELATGMKALKEAADLEAESAAHGGPTPDGTVILTDSPPPTLDDIRSATFIANAWRFDNLTETEAFDQLVFGAGLHPYAAREAVARAYGRRGGNRSQVKKSARVIESVITQAERNVAEETGIQPPSQPADLPESESASPEAPAVVASADTTPPDSAVLSPSPEVAAEQTLLDAETDSLLADAPTVAPDIPHTDTPLFQYHLKRFEQIAARARKRHEREQKRAAAHAANEQRQRDRVPARQINALNAKLKSVLNSIEHRTKTLAATTKPGTQERLRADLATLIKTANTYRRQIFDISLPSRAATALADKQLQASVEALQNAIDSNRDLILGGRPSVAPQALVVDAMLRIGNASDHPTAPMTPAHLAVLPHDLQHEHLVRRLLAPETQPGTINTNANTRRFLALAGFVKRLHKDLLPTYAYSHAAMKSGTSSEIARAFNKLALAYETGSAKGKRKPDPLRGSLSLNTFQHADPATRQITRAYVLTDRLTGERMQFPSPEAAALAADHIVAERHRAPNIAPPGLSASLPFAPPRNPGRIPGGAQSSPPVRSGDAQAHLSFWSRYISTNSRAFAKISRILDRTFPGSNLGSEIMDIFTRLDHAVQDHQNFKRIRDTERGAFYRYHGVRYTRQSHERIHNAALEISRNVSNDTRQFGLKQAIANVHLHAADAARNWNLRTNELEMLMGGIATADVTQNNTTIHAGEPLGVRGYMQKVFSDINLDAPEVAGFYYPLHHTNERGITGLETDDILRRNFSAFAGNIARRAEGVPEQEIWSGFQKEIADALDISQFTDLETTLSGYTHAAYRYSVLADPLTDMQHFISHNAPLLDSTLREKLKSTLYGFGSTPTPAFQSARERAGRSIAFPIAKQLKHLADAADAVHVEPVARAIENTYKALGIAAGRGDIRSLSEQFVWAHRNSIFALSTARAYRDATGTLLFQLYPTFKTSDLAWALSQTVPFSKTLAYHTTRLLRDGQIEADQGVRFVAERSLKHETLDRIAYVSTWQYARQDRWIRVVAQLASERAAERAMREYKSGPHAGDFSRVLETTGLDTIDPAFSSGSQRAELEGMLQRGDTKALSARTGHLIQQEVVFSYLISNAPGYYERPVGRVVGQYGVWPIQMTQRLWSLYTAPFAAHKNPDGSTNVRRAARRATEINLKYLAAAGALYSAGAAFNIDTTDWIPFLHNLAYAGGPGVSLGENLHDLLSPEGVKRLSRNPGPELAKIAISGVPIPGFDFFKRLWSQYSFGPLGRDAAAETLSHYFGGSPVAWERAAGLPPVGDTPWTQFLTADGFKPLLNQNARPYRPDLFHTLGGAPGRAVMDRISTASGGAVAPGSTEALQQSGYQPLVR